MENSNQPHRTVSVAYIRLSDGAKVEMLYDAHENTTAFTVWKGDQCKVENEVLLPAGERLVPFSPRNNLIKHGVVLLSSHLSGYESEAQLLAEIQSYIHRYVDLSEQFERITAYYVLFSWLYDAFNEVPYLRLRGDYGSGKTRFLLIVGSICYKPIFASGASTVSPIFHTLNAFRGTLILDEGDFRFSDEKADIIKILNNGTVRGLPVLRTEVSREREYNPKAYAVFGPKIVATRGHYDDRALESRFITEEMGHRPLRRDIPISLPKNWQDEALELRNKLLLFRLRNLDQAEADERLVDPEIEPRLNQMFVPLMSIVKDEAMRRELRTLARTYNRSAIDDRGMEIEAQVLRVIRGLFEGATKPYVTIKDVTAAFVERYGAEFAQLITPKWMGTVIRKKLRLRTQKSHGVYVVPISERPKLESLYSRYGITGADKEASDALSESELIVEPVDEGDIGDEPEAQTIEF